MSITDRNPIATLLGITVPSDKLAFTFEGRSFELYPASDSTWETLYTRWADGSRNVTAGGSRMGLDMRVANLLAHAFRRGLGREVADAMLARARAALAQVPA